MNLYHTLLDLPESDTPPDHYVLLGVPRFTDDAKQIQAAMIDRSTKLRAWDNTKYYREADALLNEVIAAGTILEDPARKAVYDAELRQQLGLTPATPVPAAPEATTPRAKVVETPSWADSFEEWDDESLPNLPPRRIRKSAASTPPLAVAPPVHEGENFWTNYKGLFLALGGGLIVVALLIMGGLGLRASQRAEAEQVVEAAEQAAAERIAAEQLAPAWENSVGMSFRPLSDFSIGITEVTQSHFEQVMGTNPSHFKGENNPVEGVNWDEAVAFCGKLSALPAERAAGRVYRLPTSAEWEYACRAGTTTEYSFGDAESELGEYAWFSGNSGGKTHAVGRKLANPWGLYDMHGNVWEWCQDKEGSSRVNRGGSWFRDAAYCRTAFRFPFVPWGRTRDRGFRLALSSKSVQSPEADRNK